MWVNLQEDILEEFLDAQHLSIEKIRKRILVADSRRAADKQIYMKWYNKAVAKPKSRAENRARRVNYCECCMRQTDTFARLHLGCVSRVELSVVCFTCIKIRGLVVSFPKTEAT